MDRYALQTSKLDDYEEQETFLPSIVGQVYHIYTRVNYICKCNNKSTLFEIETERNMI